MKKRDEDDSLEDDAGHQLASAMLAKLRSNVSDERPVSIHQHNLQAVLSLLDHVRHAEGATRMLEHCAAQFNCFATDEQIREWAPWVVAAVAAIAQVVPDAYVDAGRFARAFERCEPILRRAVELSFH